LAPVAILCGLLTLAPPTHAAPAGRVKRVSRAELERLQEEVERQRRLLEKIVQLQQEHVRALSQLVGVQLQPLPPVSVTPDREPPPPKPPRPEDKGKPVTPPDEPSRPRPGAGRGSISGKVIVRGGSPESAWVYLEAGDTGVTRTVQMTQKNKSFAPNVLVVQRGTRVEFPNMDPVFHNVFSVSAGNAFDLGSYKQGDSRGVVMTQPGVVSVYCNIHPQMIGFILVVPGRTYVRVGKEGFFHMEDVPAGRHKIAAWAPNARASARDVVVGQETTNVEFTLTVGAAKPHLRKDGTPYGSYNE
jgi:plastocyanin